jgi:Lrp/AsnC family transcriptional regulator, regulator for asnA, asnC and gidA
MPSSKSRRHSPPIARSLDEIDRGIIEGLTREPQVRAKTLAGKLNVSESTFATRLSALVADGVIRIVARRDIRTLGYTLIGIIEISVEGGDVDDVIDAIALIPEVIDITVALGHPQITVVVMLKDAKELARISEERIGAIAGVAHVECQIGLDILNFRPEAGVF